MLVPVEKGERTKKVVNSKKTFQQHDINVYQEEDLFTIKMGIIDRNKYLLQKYFFFVCTIIFDITI